jgi:hypothetical protein
MTNEFSSATRFSRLSAIDPDDPASWEGRLFLTIDLDWALDEAIALTLKLIEAAGVAATVFVTHSTPLLHRMRANPNIELGIHPNFNGLLDGTAGSMRTAAEILRDCLALVPEAKSVRSHSMTQSSRLLDLFLQAGLTHDCNHFIPAHTGIALKPYRHWNGLIRVPYFWEDDVDLAYGAGPGIDVAVSLQGLKVFDFHPIHVALNSTSLAQYEASRAAHRDWTALQEHVGQGEGVRARLLRLMQFRSIPKVSADGAQ